jgi:hypothetical protein
MTDHRPGAQVRAIGRSFVGDAMRLVGIRVAIGPLSALALSGRVQPSLFRESARDPIVFSLVPLALLAVGVLASLIPARRGAQQWRVFDRVNNLGGFW